jgi:hypothetical protein
MTQTTQFKEYEREKCAQREEKKESGLPTQLKDGTAGRSKKQTDYHDLGLAKGHEEDAPN